MYELRSSIHLFADDVPGGRSCRATPPARPEEETIAGIVIRLNEGKGFGKESSGMGQEIVYCSVCGDRILESEFEKGRAVTILKKNYCRKCANDASKASRPQETGSKADKTPPPRKLQPRWLSVDDTPSAHPKKLVVPLPFIIAIAIGLLAVALLIVSMKRR